MANEKKAKEDNSGVAVQRARLTRGEQIEAGWCFNPDRDPDVYRCSDEEQRRAAGEIVTSFDGKMVTDLKTGVTTTREQPEDFKVTRPVTLQEMAAASGGAVASAGADTATTDAAPAGATR